MIKFCRRYGKVQLCRKLSSAPLSAPSQNSPPILGPHPFSEPMLIFALTICICNCYLHNNSIFLDFYSPIIYQQFIVIHIKLFRPARLHNSTDATTGIKSPPNLNFSRARSLFKIIHNFICNMFMKNPKIS